MLIPQSSWLIYGLWVYVCLYIHLFNFQLTEHRPKLDRRDEDRIHGKRLPKLKSQFHDHRNCMIWSLEVAERPSLPSLPPISQPKSNLVHSSLKIWLLVAKIFMIFVTNNSWKFALRAYWLGNCARTPCWCRCCVATTGKPNGQRPISCQVVVLSFEYVRSFIEPDLFDNNVPFTLQILSICCGN